MANELRSDSSDALRRLSKPSLESLRSKYTSEDTEALQSDPEAFNGPSEDEDDYDGEEDNRVNYIPPKLIPMDEFGEDMTYQSEELLFYQDNNVITDENDMVVEDPENLIGTALTKYGFEDNDESDIFVINDNLRSYYHVHKVFDRWEG